MLLNPRLVYVAAREGHMMQVLSMVQINNLTPAPSVAFLVSLKLATSGVLYNILHYIKCQIALNSIVTVVLVILFVWYYGEVLCKCCFLC